MLITAGLQVPEIPFGDVAARTGAISVLHKFSVVAKSGIVSGVMLTAKFTGVAHCAASGVKI
ncbi:hypothetical protein D9M71_851170 [compost metagenome]